MTIRTRNLSSFGFGNAEVDLLDLKAGDSIDVQVNRDSAATVCGSVEEAMRLATNQPGSTIVAGSVYLAGEVKSWLAASALTEATGT